MPGKGLHQLLMSKKVTVSARSVRDRFNILAKTLRVKLSKQERKSGGGDKELTDVENLLEELFELSDEADKSADDQNEARKEAAENERKQVLAMRDRALEGFGETRKRIE